MIEEHVEHPHHVDGAALMSAKMESLENIHHKEEESATAIQASETASSHAACRVQTQPAAPPASSQHRQPAAKPAATPTDLFAC